MIEFIGRLHPVLVHLPIGILLLAVFFEWVSVTEKYKKVKDAVALTLNLGIISATLSCITGYWLAQQGDLESAPVQWHLWMAIATTIFALGYACARKVAILESYRSLFAFVLMALITATGHLGGSLTHGENFLFNASTDVDTQGLLNVNLAKAQFYPDLVRPILEKKCYSCHGAAKQKGNLRLDLPDGMERGGKSGKVLKAHQPDESELIHRITLSLENDDHMPPKGKPQLSHMEIGILQKWILAGADFNVSVAESGQLNSLTEILSSTEEESVAYVPESEVDAAPMEVIAALESLGVAVVPVSLSSNYLSVNLVSTSHLAESIALLPKIKNQLIWLKTGGLPVTDSLAVSIGQLHQLRKLDLQKAHITEKGVASLTALSQLIYLNLNGTAVNIQLLAQFQNIKTLKYIYLYETALKESELKDVENIFPYASILLGNYLVPTLPSDTTVLTSPLKRE